MRVFNRVHGESSWRRLVAACAVLLSGAATAGITDMVLRFSTSGPDRYADGTAAAPDDCVVLAAPLAKDGKCRDALFQVPAAEYAALEGGEWAVCLVDTRNVYGVPAGARDGKPLRVNRWGLVQSGVKIEESSKMTSAAPSLKASATAGGTRSGTSSASGVRASMLSSVPPNLKPPKITAMEISDDEVALAVEDTVPYLTYTIKSGAEPGNLKADYFADVVDGDDGGEIVIGTVKSVNRRFFKVTRAE